jgi:hypothetical protein
MCALVFPGKVTCTSNILAPSTDKIYWQLAHDHACRTAGQPCTNMFDIMLQLHFKKAIKQHPCLVMQDFSPKL